MSLLQWQCVQGMKRVRPLKSLGHKQEMSFMTYVCTILPVLSCVYITAIRQADPQPKESHGLSMTLIDWRDAKRFTDDVCTRTEQKELWILIL
jgi:hypothetical protein